MYLYHWIWFSLFLVLPDITNFSTKYFMLWKVNADEVGIKYSVFARLLPLYLYLFFLDICFMQ